MDIDREFGRWMEELCRTAGKDEHFFKSFLAKIGDSPAVYRELFYYAQHLDFLCKYRIQGYTVVDVMVWQMDHFKARLDRGEYDMQSNPAAMVLMAFDTFLDMEKNPAEYIRLMLSETGTDYPGKY